MTVPVKFRAALGDTFMMTRGLDQCLFIYTLTDWQQVVKKLKQLPMTQKNVRAFTRLFFSGATELSLDKQGRVNIPEKLLLYAQLTKACTIIGVDTRIEIWSTSHWQEYYAFTSTQLTTFAEDILQID